MHAARARHADIESARRGTGVSPTRLVRHPGLAAIKDSLADGRNFNPDMPATRNAEARELLSNPLFRPKTME
jgi:hypothetical protein